MKKIQNFGRTALVLLICISFILPTNARFVLAQETSSENLALNKSVTASTAYSTLPANNLTDEDEDSRWSSEREPVQWAYVDLEESLNINYFSLIWESDSVYAKKFNIFVSDDVNDWGTAVAQVTDNSSKKTEVSLPSPVNGRYVKLEVTEMHGYPSVSCRDFKVKYIEGTKPQDPSENIAKDKSGAASSQETTDLNATKAFDGNDKTRWSSAYRNAPHWIYVDLEGKYEVGSLRLIWETRKATKYAIQVADTLSNPMNESDWTTVKTINDRPEKLVNKIVLDEVVKARYVRIYIESATSEDPDGGPTWNTVSLREVEVYGGTQKESINDILDKIEVVQPKKGDTKLSIKYPESDDFSITYNGTDYEQVIDDDLTIYQPVVDTNVKVSFKVKSINSEEYLLGEVDVLVPGLYTVEDSDNASPVVLPELREWKGQSGNFVPTTTSKIIIKNEEFRDVANAFANDYEEITGMSISVEKGTSATANDFYFELADISKGLKDEGYLLTITDGVCVEAETTTGAYWATRTILHSLKASDFIPKGIARDYPLYAVRGFILDTGRKTFTMDYLEDVVQEMSWYKMNDFQIHLNDNLISLEDYDKYGWDPMTAYSGFRLESDIKAGEGLNQADLTSTDVFYTKDEFRNFIQESRTYGVNIVPEIDTPAHSLALTKVRPDLRLGTKGRQNDHLDLTNQYDACLEFVQSIFNEYMGSDLSNPVFDDETIVHVGADEYNANHEAYRKFADDMLKYTQEKGRTARIWGSLSVSKGDTPVRSKDVQMQLWNWGYANMNKMYEAGYDLINCNDGNYYIVPNAGYYYNYLNNNTLYNLPINSIGGVTIPAGDKQMVGGAFAVWNDMIDYIDNGVSEYDIYGRIQDPIALMGAKLWGKSDKTLAQAQEVQNVVGNAPGTDFEYKNDGNTTEIAHFNMDTLEDSSSNARDLTNGKNASIEEIDGKKALELKGGESYVNTKLETVGLNNDLRVKVKRTSESTDEQILFESAYGTIKAVQKETGKVGFSRENHDYSFEYELPLNEWVEIEIKNTFERAELYVNGELIDVIGDNDKTINNRPLLATTMIPFARIGSKTNSFVGFVDDVRLGESKTFNSTMELDYAIWNAKVVLANNSNLELSNAVKTAESVITKFAPTSEEIRDNADAINTILESLKYEEADYSRVDAYKKNIPNDLSTFTEASVEYLSNVLAGIRSNLPKALQDVVDSYEDTLKNTLQGLVLKTKANVNYVDNKIVTPTVSSHQGADNASKIIDGDETNMWHSNWSETTMPHWINLEMSTEQSINGLTYLPRQTGGGNGMAQEYRIEVSDDGITYKEVKSGKLDTSTRDAVELEFDQVTARHIRFVYLKAINNNATCAEMKIHLATTVADVSGLKVIIEKAKSVVDEGYTAESWDGLQSLITEAETLVSLDKPDANDIEIMKGMLQEKIVKLVLEEKKESSIYEELEKIIEEADTKVEATYTPNSWKEFAKVLAEAKDVVADANATQEEVDAATTKLQAAISSLVARADNEMLEAIIKEANTKVEEAYTKDSWKVFKAAMDAAKAVVADANASQETVNNANTALVDAMSKLERISEENVDTKVLEQMIASILSMNEDSYVADGWKNLEKVVEEAKTVLNDAKATQAEIDEAAASIQAAKDALVSLDELIALIGTANTKVEEAYTKDSWKAFTEVLTEVNKTLKDGSATKEDVTNAIAELTKAMEQLERVQEETVDSTKLEELLNILDKLDKSEYTADSWKALEKVVEEAKAVLAKADASQEEIDEAIEKVSNAVSKLEEKKPEELPSKDKDQEKPKEEGKGNSVGSGDQTNTNVLIGLFILGLAGIAIYGRRKYNNQNVEK